MLSPPARLDLLLPGLCAITLAAGLTQVFASQFLDNADLKHRLENLLEWYVALAFTLFFLALAWLWRHTRLTARLARG